MTALQKPGLRNLLAAIGLDVTFERAVGDLLYYRDDEGQEIEVLDLVGGYGTLLLGHNHPELIALATRFFVGNGQSRSEVVSPWGRSLLRMFPY